MYDGWFVPFVFSPRDPAKRKVENLQVKIAGAKVLTGWIQSCKFNTYYWNMKSGLAL
jgi:hypothetical protein